MPHLIWLLSSQPDQIIATSVQIDSVEMLLDIEPDEDKSIPLAESVFTCIKKCENVLYPCIVSDEVMDKEEEFDLNIEIVEAPLSRPKAIPREKGTMIDCVHDLLVRDSIKLSPKESAKGKKLLI